MSFSYVIRCSFDARAPLEAFLVWLRERHVGDVCRSGPSDAEIFVLDPSPERAHAIEVRYRFASRADFERYEREEAPRLRAEGLAEVARLGLGPGRGVVMTRWTGELVGWERGDQAAARER